MLAGLLAFAILIPTIDTFICIADIGQTISEAKSVAQAGDIGSAPAERHDDGDASCLHGHCHHWVGYSRIAERLNFEPSARHLESVRGLYDSPPSAPKTELLRPPRA